MKNARNFRFDFFVVIESFLFCPLLLFGLLLLFSSVQFQHLRVFCLVDVALRRCGVAALRRLGVRACMRYLCSTLLLVFLFMLLIVSCFVAYCVHVFL